MANGKQRGARPHDLVLFGATGFTGGLVAEYLARGYAAGGLKVALAGRDEAKLERTRARLAAVAPEAGAWPLLLADAKDEASLAAVASAAKVVCTTVGPYARYGAPLVAACVAAGTHYCDLTGEVSFVREMIDAHHEAAARSGARIVHCCGFDSIPSDLGALMMQRAMRERHGAPLRELSFFLGEMRGGVSGGTIASMLGLIEEAATDPRVRRLIADPYALVPEAHGGPDGGDQLGVRFHRDLKMWTGPFLMAGINTRVVRRSSALLQPLYGPDFRYAEATSTGRGARGILRAAGLAAGVTGGIAALSTPPLRALIAPRLPQPGEGPTREQREAGHFTIRLLGRGRDAEGRERRLRGRVEGHSDPGYGETAKMLGEAALCLALDPLDSPGGVLTPASAMGDALIERLRAAGMVFTVE